MSTQNKRIWTNGQTKFTVKPDRTTIVFAPEMNKIKRVDENIETVTKVIADTDEPVEVRRL